MILHSGMQRWVRRETAADAIYVSVSPRRLRHRDQDVLGRPGFVGLRVDDNTIAADRVAMKLHTLAGAILRVDGRADHPVRYQLTRAKIAKLLEAPSGLEARAGLDDGLQFAQRQRHAFEARCVVPHSSGAALGPRGCRRGVIVSLVVQASEYRPLYRAWKWGTPGDGPREPSQCPGASTMQLRSSTRRPRVSIVNPWQHALRLSPTRGQ